MDTDKLFDHGAPKESFDDLGEYMDKHNFSCSDFLAVVCAHLCDVPQKEFETEIMVCEQEFKIRIEKK